MRPPLSLQRLTSSFSNIQSASSWFEVYAAFSTSMILVRTAVNDFLPPAIRSFIISNLKSLFSRPRSRVSKIVTLQISDYWEVGQKNELYDAVKEYAPAKIRHEYNTLKIGKLQGKESIIFAVTSGQKFEDVFQEMKITWTFNHVKSQSSDNSSGNNHEKNMFVLSFDEKHREKVLENYIPYVLNKYKTMKEGEKVLKIHTRSGGWRATELKHPATFETLAMDPELKQAIIDDLDRFLRRKEFYKRVGKAWKRGYLFYGPPGTGKSSLVAAMANYLKFDVYDLQLSRVHSDSELETAVRTTANRSILVIEDIDCNEETHDRSRVQTVVLHSSQPYKRNAFSLSGLLNYIDGLWSSCGEERIIIFTTNYIEKLDPALLRPGRMDMHINLSYCKPHGFRTLALNYLGIHGGHHPELMEEIEGLLEKTEVTPAAVAEELMKNEDASIVLQGLVSFLKRKKMEDDEQEGVDDMQSVGDNVNLQKSKRAKVE
ncbi:AAA-ATPase [Quillaja saponaria]|uniref:AAA-ATPase n=1 Tax=Quillaja saponaria TaxID=32244 RepID=A0AAD7PD03_QUISA|nr:AAA-ATPase [Quillaja saponaria]KAJ7950429.1 AAA-ATPase [Quillaja saponaria]